MPHSKKTLTLSGRRTTVLGVSLVLLLGLLAGPAAAVTKRTVRDAKLSNTSISQLRTLRDWPKLLTFSGDKIRPRRGLKMFRVGEGVIYLTEDHVSSPPAYVTQKDVKSGGGALGNGQCRLIYDVCICGRTLTDNMYGGDATDECHFSGEPSQSSCGGEDCCGYMHSDVIVDCP